VFVLASLLSLPALAQQSVLDPAAMQSQRIANLWWFLLAVLTVIFLIVIGVMLRALMRIHRGMDQEPLEHIHAPSGKTENKLKTVVTAATVVTAVLLLVFIVTSVATGKSVGRFIETPAITIEVMGNQWWWNVRYLDDNANQIITTANEIHIPVGLPVAIRGSSLDVIHSFWVPNLNGKFDLIPSRVTYESIRADRPGHFRGQCAEFCGMQHAHMALWVVAEPQEEYEAWARAQRKPARPPDDPDTERGQQVFLNNGCVLCHSIQGTRAAGQNGPDLTHFGGRLTIAAGTRPNTKGDLAGWISDPQAIKPGNHMATIPIRSEDLQPLVDYLESLK
jgi:cytochrome c oxidase subunit 2